MDQIICDFTLPSADGYDQTKFVSEVLKHKSPLTNNNQRGYFVLDDPSL